MWSAAILFGTLRVSVTVVYNLIFIEGLNMLRWGYMAGSAGLQIRRSNRDNLGIIFNISAVKHIL